MGELDAMATPDLVRSPAAITKPWVVSASQCFNLTDGGAGTPRALHTLSHPLPFQRPWYIAHIQRVRSSDMNSDTRNYKYGGKSFVLLFTARVSHTFNKHRSAIVLFYVFQVAQHFRVRSDGRLQHVLRKFYVLQHIRKYIPALKQTDAGVAIVEAKHSTFYTTSLSQIRKTLLN